LQIDKKTLSNRLLFQVEFMFKKNINSRICCKEKLSENLEQ